MKLNNVRIRESGRKRNLFDKVNEIKQFIKSLLPEIEGDKLMAMMSHCRAYYEKKSYYGRRNSPRRRPRELTVNERIIYDWMLKNNMHPGTVYRWILASRIDIKFIRFYGRLTVSCHHQANEVSADGGS